MKSLTEQPAILTVHQGSPGSGQYIIRVASLDQRPLIVGVTKLLTDARSFVVVTPSDIKVFAVGGQVEEFQDELPLDAETEKAIAEQELLPIPGDTDAGDVEVHDEAPPARTRRRAKNQSVAGHDQSCGRCSGQGRVAVILDGGTPSDAPCPVCKGEGVLRRYGARR